MPSPTIGNEAGTATHLTFTGLSLGDGEKETESQKWISFGMRLGVSTALHPFEYAKVLIQLGYEPLTPRPGRTMFGRDVLVLPNIFKYVGFIRRSDGLSGCFVGLGPKLAGTVVSWLGSERIAKRLGFGEIADDRKAETLSDAEFFYVFKRQLSRDVVLHVSALCLSQPFHVVSVRMMAQFVGQETIYRSFWQSVAEICSDEGLFGLFAGLPAKIVCDVSCLVLATSTVYIVQKHLMKKRSDSGLTALSNFVWSSLLYPLQVVATCMTVTGSRLVIGQAPHMPTYRNWMHCYRELSLAGECKRGSSLFFRYQRPIQTISPYNGMVMPQLQRVS